MKPTSYLPFYGNDFFEAVAGYSNDITIGYLRAIWHYWNHTGCEGLPDEDEYLRRICACDIADWARIKGILFDNRYNFRLENGLWHQSRCRHEYQKSSEIYDIRSKIGKKGAAQRWKGHASGNA